MVEAACAAAFAVVAAYLLMFLLDRVFDTPPGSAPRCFVAAFVGCLRRPVGDLIAGSGATAAWSSSRGCCPQAPGGRRPAPGDHRAGPQRLRAGPFAGAVRGGGPRGGQGRPEPRLQRRRAQPPARLWAVAAAVPIVAALALAHGFPGRGPNAWARLLAPWGDAPRYTFAAARGPARRAWSSPTASRSRSRRGWPRATVWRPSRAEAQLEGQSPVAARAPATAATSSSCPSQIEPGWLTDPGRRRLAADPHRADPASRADLAGRRR